jgi:hypothetical protein
MKKMVDLPLLTQKLLRTLGSFKISFSSTGTPWHYETKEWKRTVKFYTAGLMVLWAQKRYLPEDIVQKVKDLNVSGETLLEWHQQGILAKKLDIPETKVDKIAKAIEARKTVI